MKNWRIIVLSVFSFLICFPISEMLGFMATPNDPYFSEQAYLKNTGQEIGINQPGKISGTPGADVKAEEAWTITKNNSEVVVAIMDAGIDYNHEDLKNSLWDGSLGCKNEFNEDIVAPNHGWDFLDQDNDPFEGTEFKQHGTAVAGILAAEGGNKVGIAGLNWNAKIMALRVYQEGAGPSSNSIVWAINFAKNNNVKIIVCSLLLYSDITKIKDAIIDFGKSGGIFVCGAGDGWLENQKGQDIGIIPVYPSSWNLDCVISVASTNIDDKLASFSNYGENVVDIGAPGDLIFTTGRSKITPDFNYQWLQGTCSSASLVGGLASLIWQKNPSLTNKEVKDLIIENADDIPDLNYKLKNPKRINAFRSLEATPNFISEKVVDVGNQIVCYKGVTMRVIPDEKIELRNFPNRYLEKTGTLIISGNPITKKTALENAKTEIDYWVNTRGYNFGECQECEK